MLVGIQSGRVLLRRMTNRARNRARAKYRVRSAATEERRAYRFEAGITSADEKIGGIALNGGLVYFYFFDEIFEVGRTPNR
jgi:hypothetical protein